ncbi:MAG: valine--tRNA ligase [Erysipelothrix sp.]|nr:valine--tRNA ligase [Erysipelothrix sp.]
MKKTLLSRYDHKLVEKDKYDFWLDNDLFRAKSEDKPPFCIVIPPPNVTGKLHLGHAWDTTLQDIIARYKRMQGFDMLWLAGMDHAGIATQAKVEARLKEEGISKYDLGREGFLEKAWEWKHTYADFIREQWATLGLSLDYSRERFTLDEGLSDAVKKVFVDLYNDGLIYQGERIINWDPQAQTALSNIEVIHKEIEGGMYHFRFQVVDSDEVLIVATTRPETMFGDVCVFVHPEDKRYLHLHGKTVINPASKKVMPILVDPYIDMSFGSGAMKCTPAHDPNDFNLAHTHQLEKVLCMHPDGTMNELAQAYEGMDRFDCRKQLMIDLEAQGLVERVEKHVHQVGHSERTDVIVEPYLSKQWFVSMKPLAQAVLKKQNDQGMNFVPERFEKTFIQWLENIEDWCISRQLWWGHRIPAYFHNETGEIVVSLTPPENMDDYTQDEDVLDTWFSSALWPFSTLGWPEKTSDLDRFFPNSVLVTGYDIIFFWVARMAFMSEYFMKELPFKDVLIHGLVRDASGRKMSKSLGNGVEPMDIIEKYGTDALRFYLTTSSSPGQDLRYMEEKVEASWNFINKLWNASRFVMMNMEEDFEEDESSLKNASELDAWLLTKLDATIQSVTHAMDAYDYGLAGSTLVNFTWNDFCSWYIELSKVSLQSSDPQVRSATLNTLVYALKSILKMLHPFMPFVSEEIFKQISDELSISISAYPTVRSHQALVDVTRVDRLISLISALRELRLSQSIKKANELNIQLSNEQGQHVMLSHLEADILVKMVNAQVGEVKSEGALTLPILSGNVLVSMQEHMDMGDQIAKLTSLKENLEKEMARSKAMLSNEAFLSKASASKVEAERAKASEYQRQYETILAQLDAISSR